MVGRTSRKKDKDSTPAQGASPRLPLSRDRILCAAIELADQEGIESLSMRKLAQALGVEAMSLYKHVANKDEILAGMVDLVFGEIELPAEHDWKRAMRQRSLSIRDAFLRHPWALGLMKSGNHMGDATLRHHDAVLGRLREAGFSLVGAALACSVLDSHLYGFALREQRLPFDRSKPADAAAEHLVKQMMAKTYPNLAEMAMTVAQLPDHSHTREFEFGLDLILEGLDRMRDAT